MEEKNQSDLLMAALEIEANGIVDRTETAYKSRAEFAGNKWEKIGT